MAGEQRSTKTRFKTSTQPKTAYISAPAADQKEPAIRVARNPGKTTKVRILGAGKRGHCN
jgi:hypothetical protein